MKPATTLEKRTAIHVAPGAVLLGDTYWKFSIIFRGDYSCQVIASAVAEDGPVGGERVDVTFRSMSELSDGAGSKLAAQPLPKAVVAALLAAIPTFLIDAELAYHSGADLSEPE